MGNPASQRAFGSRIYINKERLSQLKQSIKRIQSAAASKALDNTQSNEIIEVLSDFALSLEILDGYDNQSLQIRDTTSGSSCKIKYDGAIEAIGQLREKFGGSELFGKEKDASFRSSISAIDQTFGGKELYPSIEEKAANLLYFVVKNHSFANAKLLFAVLIEVSNE